MLPHRNFIIVISSPSGTGKSSIIDEIRKRDNGLSFSVSATTRKPRASEVDGKNYYFLTEEEFSRKVGADEFLEHADVFGNQYGTLKNEITRRFDESLDVIMDVDWQGNRQISSKMDRSELLRIFLLPPTMKELERRIRKRNLDNDAVVNRRLGEARNEIVHFSEYDYVVVNNDFEKSVSDVSALITAKRIGNVLKDELNSFIRNLCDQ
ncbi:MAG: guanylate kinase [Rickettsiales bacterium]|nr:guanylate kinase [Rickettsiales bacterium]